VNLSILITGGKKKLTRMSLVTASQVTAATKYTRSMSKMDTYNTTSPARQKRGHESESTSKSTKEGEKTTGNAYRLALSTVEQYV